jgi:hypothetical protein
MDGNRGAREPDWVPNPLIAVQLCLLHTLHVAVTQPRRQVNTIFSPADIRDSVSQIIAKVLRVAPQLHRHCMLMRPTSNNKHRWAVVLAGGDGTRLRHLTSRIAGDSRPKQFCHFFGGRSLLGQMPERLVVLQDGVPGWTDLGSPRRVTDVLMRQGTFFQGLAHLETGVLVCPTGWRVNGAKTP